MLLLLTLAACHPAPASMGVYHSGANAIVQGDRSGTVKVWGADGTVDRMASPGPNGTTLVGQAGPLWIVSRDVPAPVKAAAVQAATVESIGFHLKELVGALGATSIDPALSSGVWVRSVVKVRQEHAPPILLVAATRDDIGTGRIGGPPDTRSGEGCAAVVATLDAKATKVLHSLPLDDAKALCAPPGLLPPVDRDGDGVLRTIVYGESKSGAFRAWFTVKEGGELVEGESDRWKGIPG